MGDEKNLQSNNLLHKIMDLYRPMKRVGQWFDNLFFPKSSLGAVVNMSSLLLLVGLVISLGAGAFAFKNMWGAAVTTLLLVEMAASASGFLIGFLFGIPKVLQSQTSNGAVDYGQSVNTNLEQISDWLTKIIVGVGLVEFKDLSVALWRVSQKLSQSFSATGDMVAVAAPTICAGIVYFLTVGVLAGYLLTRLHFSAAFAEADVRALTQAGTRMAADVPQANAATRDRTDISQFSADGLKVLATLAKFQREHFPDAKSKRWTFTVSPAAPDYTTFLKGTVELKEAGLVAVVPENHHVMLTDGGLEFVAKNATTLDKQEHYTFFRGA